MVRMTTLLASLLALPLTVNAAQVTVEKHETSDNHYIKLVGGIEPGDDFTLSVALDDPRIDINDVVLELDSPGGAGNAMRGLKALVEKYKINTLVREGSQCYSACAVVWVSGKTNYVDGNPEIGFHIGSIQDPSWFREVIETEGYYGLQEWVQFGFASNILFYRDDFKDHVFDADKFALDILQHGFNRRAFYTPTQDELALQVKGYTKW